MLEHHQAFKYAEKLGFGELHFKIDHELDLFAIIAIHNTKRGPAIGGCRWIAYDDIDQAIFDAIRLARGMTFKSAISNLPQGGGKAVLIRPKVMPDYEKYFKAYAEFINELGGIYITAADSGTSAREMDTIARYTKFVSSTTTLGNPAILTARGVLRGIEAALKFKYPDSSGLKDKHITVQGLGQVGYLLAKACHEQGARLTVADVKTELAARCAQEFKADVVSSQLIHAVKSDVFSPCALGGILNDQTISELGSPIIAGAANNQLLQPSDGNLLNRMGILYAPDYVINAGGVIQASGKYHGAADHQIEKKVDHIYNTLMKIFKRSTEQQQATSDIADSLAMEMLEKDSAEWQ